MENEETNLLPDADGAPGPTSHSATTYPEPRVGSALGSGWRKMQDNFLVFFLPVLVLVVMEIPFQGASMEGSGDDSVSPFFGLLGFAYRLLFMPVVNYGIDLVFLRGVRGDPVEMKSMFDGFQNYINVVLTALLVFGLVGIGFIALVIPGIYVACRLVFASYLVMDEGMEPIAAVEASWRITRGHTWTIFLLGLTSFFLFVLGMALLLVGIFPAIMWIKASFASLYLSITRADTTV
ncbi:MAG: hypothetical protein Q7V56_09875 [Gammaproteobacteria bacterium]|nr:hypothetical protein [Gammaproteobacteria bacterium]